MLPRSSAAGQLMQCKARQSHGQPARCCPSRACRHRLRWLIGQHTTFQLGVQVTGAEAALRKMLPLVFSKEQGDCLLLHACCAGSVRAQQTHWRRATEKT